ncbi:hypothetical protein GOP47_0024218 [Adiantum capillus-veneris]|uniref:Uncharacterized protein n=1 Tax=Adiantum capillus-veneris TaxID=13818 RepID=A0A9D4U661_ADICA|nr:hypothetical protein GOP47_0024218 [Adiantum capillus-veneris]
MQSNQMSMCEMRMIDPLWESWIAVWMMRYCMDDEVLSSLNKDAGPISDDEADTNQPMYSVFNEDISSEENALTVGCEIECCTKFSVEKLSKNLMQNERYADEDDNPEWGFLDAEADIDNDMHVCVDEGMMHLDSGMRTKADSFTRPADFVDEETTIGDFLAALEDQDDGLEGACVQSEALQVPNASIVSIYTELKEANSNACKTLSNRFWQWLHSMACNCCNYYSFAKGVQTEAREVDAYAKEKWLLD